MGLLFRGRRSALLTGPMSKTRVRGKLYYLGANSLHKVEIMYVPTDDNLADVLTKALSRTKFEGARTSIGVLPA